MEAELSWDLIQSTILPSFSFLQIIFLSIVCRIESNVASRVPSFSSDISFSLKDITESLSADVEKVPVTVVRIEGTLNQGLIKILIYFKQEKEIFSKTRNFSIKMFKTLLKYLLFFKKGPESAYFVINLYQLITPQAVGMNSWVQSALKSIWRGPFFWIVCFFYYPEIHFSIHFWNPNSGKKTFWHRKEFIFRRPIFDNHHIDNILPRQPRSWDYN